MIKFTHKTVLYIVFNLITYLSYSQYCTPKTTDSRYEHISNVIIDGTGNPSDDSGGFGYSDFTGATIFPDLVTGSTIPITIEKDWRSTVYAESVAIWIDFNQNNTFEGSERVFFDARDTDPTASGTITIPTSAALCNTTMRVVLLDRDLGSTPCAVNRRYGETEDYTVNIVSPDPEIIVSGNSNEIVNNDSTPAVADNTDFGTTIIGTPVTKTFTIRNDDCRADLNLSGASPYITLGDNVNYSVTTIPNNTITANNSTTFVVTFNPTTLGVKNTSITINSNDPDESSYRFAITGNCIPPAPEIQITGNSNNITDGDTSPSAIDNTDFGTTGISTPVTKTFIIENTGTADLILAGTTPFVTISDAVNYTVTTPPNSTITPGGSTSFVITYNPTTQGVKNATVTIRSNDSDEDPFTFAITGDTVPAEIRITGQTIEIVDGDLTPDPSDNTDFGTLGTGLTDIRTYVIENNSAATLNLTGTAPTYINISGLNPGDFSITANPSNIIAPNSSTTFTIEFAPTTDGPKEAIISIANDDPDENPYEFKVAGLAVPPVPEIRIIGNATEIVDGDTTPSTGENTNFGNVALGSQIDKQYIIENTGTGDLLLTDPSPFITLSDNTNFFISVIPQGTISPTNPNKTTFFIAYLPSALGTHNCTVTIANNDPDESSYTFNITGTCVASYSESPGGVNSDLHLWLKSTEGLAYSNGQSVTTWQTQALGSDATTVVAGQEPIYKDNSTDNINFNPVVDFTNTPSAPLDNTFTYSDSNDMFLMGSGGFYTQDIFLVVMPDINISSSSGIMDVFCGDSDISSNEQDVTGIGFGNYTARLNNEVISYCTEATNSSGTINYGIAESSTTKSYSSLGIINARNHPTDSQSQELYLNGLNITNQEVHKSDFINVNNSRYWIGRSENYHASADVRIAEIITYSSRKNDASSTDERNRIMSYLGLKYGITLGTNGTSQDYVDSSGSFIWNQSANTGYNYDIAGIGKDENSELYQKQSKSINSDTDGTGEIRGLLTIGVDDIYATNSANPNTIASDRTFLMWGNNNADLNDAAATINVDLSTGIAGLTTPVEFTSMKRTWKVVESGGDMPRVKITIPQNAIRNITPPGDFLMFISDTENFDPTADYRVLNDAGSGLLETTYDFDGTKYITFGYAPERTFERSIAFDGADDYVDMDDVLDLNPNGFTISAWIKINTLTGGMSIASKRNYDYDNGYDFKVTATGKLELSWGASGANVLTGNTTIPINKWHHVAGIYDGSNMKLYIDGVEDTSGNLPQPQNTDYRFRIAAAGKNTVTSYFNGTIDELRVWNTALTEDQMRYVMNQEIEQDGTKANGKTLPTTIAKNDIKAIDWTELEGYYPMDRYTYSNVDDESGNRHKGALRNITTVDFQTAPLPYESNTGGSWTSSGVWLNGSMQNIPGNPSLVDSNITVDWNIVRTNHDINMDNTSLPSKMRTVLGLDVASNKLTLDGITSSSTASGNGLIVSHYLNLDGKIDLEGESQLIQNEDSELDSTSGGSLERDQQGTLNKFTYNYWSSPVGAINTSTNNNSYSVADVLKDGSSSSNPKTINFTSASYDGSKTDPITIANYWIWKFSNNTNNYSQWQNATSTGSINAGEGFTMKGVDADTDLTKSQNYVFQGKPNNGDITLPITANYSYLVGNPYPSAINADEFLTDNPNTTGTLYFWEHYGGSSHALGEYQGGYGTYTLSGGSPATSHGDVDSGGTSTKTPALHIPIGQGFFVKGQTSGTINFRNSQRDFVIEDLAHSNSVFVKQMQNDGDDDNSAATEDKRPKIRVGYKSPKTYRAQLLVTADPRATTGVDWGFDGKQRGSLKENMYWMIEDDKYAVQGIDEFKESTALPLGLHTDIDGESKILIDALENMPEDKKIYLYDKVADVYHDLKLGEYTVFLNAGEYLERFEITFNNGITLSNEDNTFNSLNTYFNNHNKSIVINNPELQPLKSVELYNIIGQKIAVYPISDNKKYMQFTTSKISDGIYTIKVNTENNSMSKKVIVK